MSMTGAAFAKSADRLVMESAKDCFDSGVVYTFLDENSNLPLFTVTDSEWDYFVINVPRSKSAICTAAPTAPPTPAPTAAPSDPCAPQAAGRRLDGVDPCAPQTAAPPAAPVCFHPKVYGHVIADRVCLEFANSCTPEFGTIPSAQCIKGENQCHPSCGPPKNRIGMVTSTLPPPAPCRTCYDCEGDDIIYAILGTWFTFFFAMNLYRKLDAYESKKKFLVHSGGDISKKFDVDHTLNNRNLQSSLILCKDCFFGANMKFGLMVFIFTCLVYAGLNWINYFVVVKIKGKEMCMKIWAMQTTVSGGQTWSSMEHWSALHGNRVYNCFNDACPFRLLPLMLITWLSMTALFIFSSKEEQVEGVTNVITSTQVEVEAGAGGGTDLGVSGSKGGTRCAVQ
jgi:hypothetical protein